MIRSHWKLHVNVKKEASAKKVISKCIMLIERPPMEGELLPYSKGGYMGTFELAHGDISWPELVYEVLGFSQKLGGGWILGGHLQSSPSAVLSSEIVGTRITVPGLSWAAWEVSKNSDCETNK